MLAAKICIILASGASVFSHPIFSAVHERRDSAPDGFTTNGPANQSFSLNMRVLLTSNDLSGLETAVYQNAHRGNGVFKEPLTTAQIKSFVAPTTETTTKVTGWLHSNAINYTTISPAGDWLQINVNVLTANRILNANFMSFNDDSTGKEVIRTLSYSVPSELQPHIQLIHPTIAFPIRSQTPPLRVKSRSGSANLKSNHSRVISARQVPSACDLNEITPICVSALYGIPLTTLAPPQNASRMAIAAFSTQFPQSADLQEFLEFFDSDIASNSTFTLESLDGGSDPQSVTDSGIFADAIVEYTVGLAPNIPIEVIAVGSQVDDGVDGNLDLALSLLAQSDPPQVLLLPSGFNENSIPVSLAQTLCNSYMQLSSMGVSIIVASGDGGVSGIASSTTSCSTAFVPTFPSTCPFVTSVGATSSAGPETAATFSGGGFSNVFSTPSFQQSAVSQYLTFLGDAGSTTFNTTGRGFPDVSTHGDTMALVVGGATGVFSTTIISAAIFASVIAQLNAVNIRLGFPVLGLLNPFIYDNPAISTDITTGKNLNSACGTDGFSVTTGWDPVTGVGTPIYSIMNAELKGF